MRLWFYELLRAPVPCKGSGVHAFIHQTFISSKGQEKSNDWNVATLCCKHERR